jgi:hypothetical protein
MMYVPAGVPVVVVVVLPLLHAGKNIVAVNRTSRKIPDSARRPLIRLPRSPLPSRARPSTGKNVASSAPARLRSSVVVVTRAVVLMIRVDVTALVLGIVSGVVVNEQAVPVGSPDEHESEMLLV